MNPREFYENLLSQLNDDLEKKIFQVLVDHIGEKVSRDQLLKEINCDDRIIRKCIERLRLKSFPIVSTSGESGYTLTDDPVSMEIYILEELSRIEHISEKIIRLRMAKDVAGSLREWRESSPVAIQDPLF